MALSFWDVLRSQLVQPVLVQLNDIQTKLGKLMSEDAAIEAQVTILNADAAALAQAFVALQAQVANGGSPTDQAMQDLEAAVTTVTGTLPPAPTPPPV